jgi:hypothetical protein
MYKIPCFRHNNSFINIFIGLTRGVHNSSSNSVYFVKIKNSSDSVKCKSSATPYSQTAKKAKGDIFACCLPVAAVQHTTQALMVYR